MSMLAWRHPLRQLNRATWTRPPTSSVLTAFPITSPSPWRHFRSNAILLGLLGGSASALFFCNTSHHTIRLDDPSNVGTRVDPATSIAFPTTLQPPSSSPLTLIGLGVRTVSFLSIKVYSVGFYADMQNIEVPETASFDERIDTIVKNATCAIRIVPTRTTTYMHLRDAFLRSLRSTIVSLKKANALTPDQEQALEQPLQELKAVFPLTQFQKHTPLVVYSSPTKNPSDARSLIFDGLGDVKNTWIAEHFFKVYFTGKGVSQELVKTVKEAVRDIGLPDKA